MRGIFKCGHTYVESPDECGETVEPLIDASNRRALSRLMSYILRHSPRDACIELEKGGWVGIEELVMGIRECWKNRERYHWVMTEHVMAVAALDPKGRFEVRNGRIRAVYGHSKSISPDKLPTYEEDSSVKVLYHGTASHLLKPILAEGVRPGKRYYVHLTTDPVTASETGSRRGTPVVLEIDAECLRRSGYKVLRASNVIYLVEYIPPECIRSVMKKVLTNP